MPDAAFFRPDLFNFLRQLKRHNNREWFAKNMQRYEEAVRDPALLFIENFGPRLHSLSPHFVADPRLTRGSWAWSEGSAGRWMTSRAIAGDDTGVSAYGLIHPEPSRPAELALNRRSPYSTVDDPSGIRSVAGSGKRW